MFAGERVARELDFISQHSGSHHLILKSLVCSSSLY